MKNLIRLCFILSTSQAYSQETAITFSKALAQKSGELILVHNEVFGFTENKSGEVKGLLVDVMIEFEVFVKEKHGINLTHRFVHTDNDFSKFLTSVEEGKGGVFGLGNISITEDRKKIFSFSPPFLENVSLLVTNKSVPNINSQTDLEVALADMTGYVVQNTTNHEGLKKLRKDLAPALQMDYFDTANEVMNKVSGDPKAIAILDLNYYLEALNRRLAIKRQAVYDQKDDPFGIIMPLISDWEPVISAFFNSGFLESVKYRQIIAKHLGSSSLGLLDSFRKR